jgi:acetamidase/formamidase
VAVARAAEHELRAGPKTTHFGGWSAAHPHVLEVDSGDVVRMWTVTARLPCRTAGTPARTS